MIHLAGTMAMCLVETMARRLVSAMTMHFLVETMVMHLVGMLAMRLV